MFTKEQIKEIADRLAAMGKRDSQFPVTQEVTNEDFVPILQDNKNKLASIKTIMERAPDSGDIGNIEELLDELENSLIAYMESLEDQTVSLTISCPVSGAEIYVNGEAASAGGQYIGSFTRGTLIEIKVQAEGYATFHQVVQVWRTQTLVVHLNADTGGETPPEPVENVTLTVTATPSIATIRLNGVERSSITVEKGSSVHINVTASGYKEYDEDYIVNSTETKKITLESDSQFEYTDLKMTPSLENVPADGFQQQMTVLVSYIDWDGTVITDEETSRAVLTSEQDWIRIDGYMVTISENTSTESRSGKIKVTTSTINGAKTISKEFNVVQLGTGAQEETISLVPESLQFTSEGGSKTVQVTSNANWEIQ